MLPEGAQWRGAIHASCGALGIGRILTDFAGDRYWTIISEYEVPSLQAFEEMMSGKGMTEEMNREFERIMEGYHELIDHGHREIYKVEG